MSQVGDTPNSRTSSDHQEGINLRSPSTNELCIKLIEEFMNGRISKDKAIRVIINTSQESDAHDRILAIQIQMAISAYIAMLDLLKPVDCVLVWGEGYLDMSEYIQVEMRLSLS